MKKIILLVLLFGFCKSYSQNEIKSLLFGKWSMIKLNNAEFVDSLKISFSENESKKEKPETLKFYLWFKENDSLITKQHGMNYKTTFKVKDSVLVLGNREYFIKSIDRKILKLKDKRDLFPSEYVCNKIN